MNDNHKDNVVLLAGTSVPHLSRRVSEILKIPLSEASITRFIDGEVQVQIGIDVILRDRKVFIIQSTFPPAEHWFEIWLLADAARRAGARDIIWIAPYLGYARQDRKMEGHDPISAAVVLTMTVAAGVTQIVGLDLHCGQLQGFVPIPFSNLWGRKLIVRYVLEMLNIKQDEKDKLNNFAIIAPDAGSLTVASYYARKLGCLLIVGAKTRPKPGQSTVSLLDGEKAAGRICLILDEMTDTANTLLEVSEKLSKIGASRIIAGITHVLLAEDAIERIENSAIDEMIVTDTIPLKKPSPKIKVVSVAEELAKAIEVIATKGIVSSLAREM